MCGRRVFTLILVVLATGLVRPLAVADNQGPVPLRVGFAQEEITPPVGMRLCGSFHERVSTGVHDPLWARANVFAQGSTAFAIVGCDLAMISPSVASQARTAIEASCGLPPENVLIHGSETHNGPDYFGEFREAFRRRAFAEHGSDPAEPVDFARLLAERIAQAVCDAHANLASASIACGETSCKGIAFYRRFRMSDGSIGWNPGKLNPAIVEPAGSVDPSVPVVAVYRKVEKTPTAILTGFAMHLAILNDSEYGADYPYYLTRYLRDHFGSDVFVHFMQAPCCEVNHVDVSHDRPQKGHAWAQHVGQALGDAVIQAVPNLNDIAEPHLATATRTVLIKLREYPPDEVAQQRHRWYSEEREGTGFLDLVHAATVTGIYDRHEGGPVPVLLQAFRIDNELAIVGLPGEVSVEFGLSLKQRSPFQKTIVVQLSNDWFGYIPPRRIFAEGNYEAVVAKIKPGEGERMVEHALDMLRELKGM